jgi:nicotinamidase-related amidase
MSDHAGRDTVSSLKTGLNALLTPEESVLVLIDHQPFQFANLNSHEPTMIVNNVIGLAKTAKAFGVPVILTTVVGARGGKIIKGIQDVFPNTEVIDRSFINTWQDERVMTAVKATKRKKLVLASLWTEMCLAMPAIQAQGEGFEVYVVTDASGGVSPEAHDMAVRRMVQAGIVPITWMALLGEWQRDWAREDTIPALANLLIEHGGATGVAYAWNCNFSLRTSNRAFDFVWTRIVRQDRGFDLLPDLSLTLYLSPLIAEDISNRTQSSRRTAVRDVALQSLHRSRTV